ncbi:MAG: tetratricopeptide repeat protein [Planctomycetota bacterium]|nr:tetratricopeptide repeat protein [Planctomycetota bacterium]
MRFRWKKGDIFSYRMEAEVVEGTLTSILEGEVTLRVQSPTAAILDRQIKSLMQQEGDAAPVAATATELSWMRIMIPIGPGGGVPKEAGLSGEEEEAVTTIIASIFPFPPAGAADDGKPWEIRLPSQGDRLIGQGRFGKRVRLEGISCVEIQFEASSAETRREMDGKAYYSSDLGAFVEVEREIRFPGPPERREKMRLRLRRHPSGPVLDPRYRSRLGIAREATREDPENAVAWARLSAVLRDGGSLAEALTASRKAASLRPDQPEYRRAEADLLALQGRLDDAIRILLAILEERPRHLSTLLTLGRVFFQTARFEEASDLAEKAREVDADSVEARFLLGLVRGKQRRTGEAASLIRSCYPSEEGKDPPVVTFDPDGNLRLVLPRSATAERERPPLTAEERDFASQILAQLVKEEAKKLRMEEEEVDRLLGYMASVCETDTATMMRDFLEDRDGTAKRIQIALDRRREIPLEKMRELAKSDDPELRAGAALFLPVEEAVPIVQGVIRQDPTRPDTYLQLAAILMRLPKRDAVASKTLLSALRTGNDLDPTNAIYGYLTASIQMEEGLTILALDRIAESLGRHFVLTHRAREARLRRRVLAELSYDPYFRAAAAWGDSTSPFAPYLAQSAQGLIAFAQHVEGEGKAADARKLLETVLWMGAQWRKSVDEFEILREAEKIEMAALEALIGLDDRVKDEEAGRLHRRWKNEVEKDRKFRAEAMKAFLQEREDALYLWPITDPARSRDYLRRVSSGEREVFEGFLRKARETGK